MSGFERLPEVTPQTRGKSEVPKAETRKKSEARNPNRLQRLLSRARSRFLFGAPSDFGFRISFGLRISDFGFQLLAGLLAFATLHAASPIQAASGPPSPPKAAVFYDSLPGSDQALARDIAAQVRAAGYATELIFTPVLTNQALLTPRRFDLLVLPSARALPLVAAPAIVTYLRGGGDLLALGLPAWQSPVFQINGQWLTRRGYEDTIAAQRPRHLMEDFNSADLSRWTRHTGEAGVLAQYELTEQANAGHGKALHVKLERLGGWQTLGSPALLQPFPTNHTLTCFRARGGPRTRQLSLEWKEQDGSRWIATVDLSPEWKDYTLLPDRFKAWPPESVSEDRLFNPAKAASCCVGLALSHTALEGEQHEYWFDELGTAPNPLGDDTPPSESSVPQLESVSPSYQCYPITTPVVVKADHLKASLEEWEKSSPPGDRRDARSYFGVHPRARGVGFEQGRPYRWEPLLGAYDAATQDYRGALGALLVNVAPPFRGSVWAVFTPADAAFYQQPVVTNCLRQVLSRMKRGVFLSEGGSEFFTLFADQEFQAGARVVNFGSESVSNLSLTVSLLGAKGRASRAVFETNFTVGPGETITLAKGGLAKQPNEDSVSVALNCTGAPIDALRHELGVWQPRTRPKFIEARDGGFWLGGKPWKAHGINYMPSSGIALANGRYFEYWLGRGAYDPEVIERDLRRVKAMNLNAVSVFIHYTSLDAQHLLDFLRRCDALGLRVNQSLRPGTPMAFQWDQMKELIEFYQLARNDTVFAYDLAWEPSHGGYSEQQHNYAGLWHEWALKKYGSLSAATNAWGVPAPPMILTPRTALTPPPARVSRLSLDVPPMSQLTADGPWRKLVADYRFFLAALLHEKYSVARDLIRSIDLNHAVSFRMSNAGDPLYNWDSALPYDFYGLADAVDIWEPEAYGRIGEWDRVRPGTFTAAYARLCDPGKPFVWAEMGYTAWDMNRLAPAPEKLAFAARYYADFYRMLIESGSDGIFFWWYPGGFRLGENSDFGVINPDGTDRPVTQIIRTEGPRFLQAPKPDAPNEWIAVNRDRDARGLPGIYQAVQERFWKAMELGQRPGLSYERQSDTTK
jgi:hypothetical protein